MESPEKSNLRAVGTSGKALLSTGKFGYVFFRNTAVTAVDLTNMVDSC